MELRRRECTGVKMISFADLPKGKYRILKISPMSTTFDTTATVEITTKSGVKSLYLPRRISESFYTCIPDNPSIIPECVE